MANKEQKPIPAPDPWRTEELQQMVREDIEEQRKLIENSAAR